MKIRTGFVSNSSSSSFVIIDAKQGYNQLPWRVYSDTLVIDHDKGVYEFGWGPEKITDMGSRFIWAYLQAIYPEWRAMLDKVILDYTGYKHIEWHIITYEVYNKINDAAGFYLPLDIAYIDHQSSAVEGMNTDIFNSEQQLKDFLFGKGSYIQLDNDNHD